MEKQKQVIKCPGCQVNLQVEVPLVSVINQPAYSMLVLVHESPQACPQCQGMVQCVITSIEPGAVKIGWLPVAPESLVQVPKIVIPN